MNVVKEGLDWLDERYYLHPVVGRIVFIVLSLAALFALAGYDLRQPWTVPCQMETRLCMGREEIMCPPLDAWFCPDDE